MKSCLFLIAILSVAAGVMLTPSATQAFDSYALSKVNPTARAERQEARQERYEEKTENLEARCEEITTRIQTKVARYDNNKSLFLKWNEQMISLTEKFIDRAEESDLDTTAVKADLAVFKDKSHASEILYADYITALKEAQAYACGKSDGAFKQELSEARELLSQVHDSMQDLRSYYQTELRPEIQALKSQKAAQ